MSGLGRRSRPTRSRFDGSNYKNNFLRERDKLPGRHHPGHANLRVMRGRFVLLLLSILAIPAFAGEMIWSPNHSRAVIVDTSTRRNIISIKSGANDVRLFYGHFGDALDAWKPGLSKLYGIPESQVGKIVLPSFVAAKWISENEVQIDLDSAFTTMNLDTFEFTVRALVSGDGKTLSTKFGHSHAAQ